MCCEYFSEVVYMYHAWNAANSLTYSGRERAECSILKDVFTCMYVCFTGFVCILSNSVEFISEIFSFLFATCLSVFLPPFQFLLDDVGLRPLVLWYTKISFTSLHGKCSVIHRSDAPFQFPLDEVGLRPLVLWYTKISFTSLHGKCSVIHGSNAGNA